MKAQAILVFIVATQILIGLDARAQVSSATVDSNAIALPTIFIDCGLCDQIDMDFFKTNLPFVTFVRDKTDADIFVILTTASTGSGGGVVTVTLTSQRTMRGTTDTVTYTSQNSETDDSTRKGVLGMIKLGLVRFIERSPLARYLSVSYDQPPPSTAKIDKWNSWVFSIEANPWFNGEQSRHTWSVWGQLSARRVTKEMKTNLSLYTNYSRSTYVVDTTETSSDSKSNGCDGSYFWSLTNHWSVGLVASVWNSTWSNTRSGIYSAAAIEYNIFPYDQSTRHQLRFGYRMGAYHKDYFEETIYDKMSEWLVSEKISASLTIIQPFGSATAEIVGLHYFHDFDKNLLQFSTNCSIRLIRGLSLNFNGYYSRVHDQISLAKGNATDEEVFLQRRELATSYRYNGSLSLSYSFGSMYNNIVNARFGN